MYHLFAPCDILHLYPPWFLPVVTPYLVHSSPFCTFLSWYLFYIKHYHILQFVQFYDSRQTQQSTVNAFFGSKEILQLTTVYPALQFWYVLLRQRIDLITLSDSFEEMRYLTPSIQFWAVVLLCLNSTHSSQIWNLKLFRMEVDCIFTIMAYTTI
jgi:hypothetical protein